MSFEMYWSVSLFMFQFMKVFKNRKGLVSIHWLAENRKINDNLRIVFIVND